MRTGFLWEGQNEGDQKEDQARHSWKDNIKIDVRKIRWRYVEYIHLTQDKDQWIQ
jgi:hypothetical protein